MLVRRRPVTEVCPRRLVSRRVQADDYPPVSLFRFITESDPSFDIHQRDIWGRTILMQPGIQYLQAYKELIRLGADAKAVDTNGSTSLHHFFMTNLEPIRSNLYDALLDGGDILALLIQAGADPKAINRFGAVPRDIIEAPYSLHRFGYLRTVWKGINLAFWHQALRLCGLSGSTYCECSAHPRKKIPLHDFGYRCQPCLRGSAESLQFDTFEEEMSAALAKWDENAAQSIHVAGNVWVRQYEDRSNDCCHRLDVWVQKVLIELEARQKKAHSGIRADLSQVVGDRAKDVEERRPEREETQASNHTRNFRSNLATRESDVDEDWSTSSSIDSEDEWESAPET